MAERSSQISSLLSGKDPGVPLDRIWREYRQLVRNHYTANTPKIPGDRDQQASGQASTSTSAGSLSSSLSSLSAQPPVASSATPITARLKSLSASLSAPPSTAALRTSSTTMPSGPAAGAAAPPPSHTPVPESPDWGSQADLMSVLPASQLHGLTALLGATPEPVVRALPPEYLNLLAALGAAIRSKLRPLVPASPATPSHAPPAAGGAGTYSGALRPQPPPSG
ncbi:hypothetical protein PAPYR_7520 [Paratrimastix pyriformis]|uniref:Uncharacterized protein n=1 Tax=Paratrimastix pyriformis TaxID=342808 RepID=A0ABQ8UD05_9EUKA|nr:hypothetical protein PAPYR_7520 [Paratrimastix pyriformis]